MKKYENGKYIDLTAEELEEMREPRIIVTEPTIIERLEAIEALLLEGVLSGD